MESVLGTLGVHVWIVASKTLARLLVAMPCTQVNVVSGQLWV